MIVTIAHEEACVNVPHEERRKCRADRVECREGRRDDTSDNETLEPKRRQVANDKRVDGVVLLQGLSERHQARIRIQRPADDPDGQVRESRYQKNRARDDDGHLQIPFAARAEHSHRLRMVHDRVRKPDDEKSGANPPDRGSFRNLLLVFVVASPDQKQSFNLARRFALDRLDLDCIVADVEHFPWQVGVVLGELLLEPAPPPDRAPDHDEQNQGRNQHHDRLQRIGDGHRLQPAERGVDRGE